jgi:hypothetical protein
MALSPLSDWSFTFINRKVLLPIVTGELFAIATLLKLISAKKSDTENPASSTFFLSKSKSTSSSGLNVILKVDV